MTVSETEHESRIDGALPHLVRQLSDVLELGRTSFSDALVDAPSYRRLARACSRLPADLSTFWGVETRLSDRHAAVDLLVEVKRGSPGHGLLGGTKPSIVDELVSHWPVWRRIRDFARHWEDESGGGYCNVRNLWLEFDIAAAGSDYDVDQAMGHPCVFWGPEGRSAGDQGFFDDLVKLIANFYPLWVAPERLDDIASGLSGDARVFQVGAMGSREDAVLRLCVNRMTARDLVPWLDAIDWPGDASALEATLTTLRPLIRDLAVGIDVTAAGVAAKIGIECYLDWSVEQARQWRPLLDYLLEHGLLTNEKRRALELFPERSSYGPRQQLRWIRDGVMYPVLIRNIHHIKLGFCSDRVSEAKGYLGLYRPGVRLNRFLASATQQTVKGEDDPDGWYVP
jgi:hypothetical protein